MWYFVLVLFGTTYLKTEALCGKGWSVEKGSHSHVVLISDGSQSPAVFLATGSILNTRWVLTLAQPIKNATAGNLAILAGLEISTDNSDNKFQIEKKVEQPDDKPEYALALLKTTSEIKFNGNVSDVFHGLTRNSDRYLHCELVTWYNNGGNTWIKTRIFVDPESGCESEQEFCIKVFLKGKTPINPCVHSLNLGAPLMCDVSLEGIFFGEGQSGCTNPQENSVNKALLLEKSQNVTDWLYGTAQDNKPSSDQKNINYNLESDNDFAENDIEPSDKEDDMVVLNDMVYQSHKCIKD